MAAISDDTIMSAIKILIEGTSSLYDVSDSTKINKVYTEPNKKGKAQQNYCEILPPGGTIRINERGGTKIREIGDAKLKNVLMGNSQKTLRPFTIIMKFKQVRSENNTRIYDAVKNFRDAIKADETLSISGIDGSTVTSWGYMLNKDKQTITDGVGINLSITCTESF